MATNTISISGVVNTNAGTVTINDSFSNTAAVGFDAITIISTGTTAVTVPNTANGFYYKVNIVAVSVTINGTVVPLVSIGFQPLLAGSLASFNVLINTPSSGSVQIIFV